MANVHVVTDEMTALRAAKKELRAVMKRELGRASGSNITDQSSTITATVLSMPLYKSAKRIGIYLSMPKGEVMTRDIVKDALAQNKQVFVPVIQNTTSLGDGKPRKVMEMVSLHSKEDHANVEANRDAWGIPTVWADSIHQREAILGYDGNLVSKGGLDMVLMPGVAFDRKFGRLGHGKGFYDFFLQNYHDSKVTMREGSVSMPFLVGLALKEQILPGDQKVPANDSDWRLDALVSGDGSITEVVVSQ